MENWLNVLNTHTTKRVVVNSVVDKYLLENSFIYLSELKEKPHRRDVDDEEENADIKKFIERYNSYFKNESRAFTLSSTIDVNNYPYNIKITIISDRILGIIPLKGIVPLFKTKYLSNNLDISKLEMEKDISEVVNNLKLELDEIIIKQGDIK